MNSYFLIFKDCVTSSFIPVKPFNVTAQPEPTVEVEEFVYDSTKYCRPYRVYKNQIYIYPKHLKYDSQKCFNKVWYVSEMTSSLSTLRWFLESLNTNYYLSTLRKIKLFEENA